MLYLIQMHGGWLAATFAIGLAMGWVARVQHAAERSGQWLKWLLPLLAAGLVVSLLRLVPGRAGYWLDLGLLMVALYMVGCQCGTWLRLTLLPASASSSLEIEEQSQSVDRG